MYTPKVKSIDNNGELKVEKNRMMAKTRSSFTAIEASAIKISGSNTRD
jgi:hypothetical protein